MDKAKFSYYLNSIKKFNAESDEMNEHLSFIASGAICELGYSLLDDYMRLLSESVGDEWDWIPWFVFDNEFGDKKIIAGYDGKERSIKNVSDLWGLIEEGKAK